jgi:hypothetical protein
MAMIKPRRRRLQVVTWLCASYISVAHSFVITVDSPRILLFGAPPSVKRRGSPAAHLYSFSSPQQPQNEPLLLDNDKSPPFDSFIKDVTTLFMYSCWCCLVALAISMYQDFDVSHIKPQGILRDQALYGMAYGNDKNSILPSYNTVMQQHRELRLTMWNQPLETLPRQDAAVVSIVKALQSIQELKKMANNYEWDDMQIALRQPLFTSQLEEACSVLRRTAASTDARDEIGFDWGRCVRRGWYSVCVFMTCMYTELLSCQSKLRLETLWSTSGCTRSLGGTLQSHWSA